jgi:hypothetical protein
MALETVPDVEIIELLEFDSVVACEADENEAEVADWYATCRKCRGVTPVCEKHRAEMAADILKAPYGITACGNRGQSIDELFELTPIKRGSHGC